MTTVMAGCDTLLAHVRREYREMPGLRLTVAQAARLWQLDPRACAELFETLLGEGFLTRTDDGVFLLPSLRDRHSGARQRFD